MKKIVLLMLAFMPLVAFAQDRIQTVDGRSITAKIIEIDEDSIAYKDYSNLEGPTYRLSLARIASITFENGSDAVYNEVPKGFTLPSRIEERHCDIYGDGVLIPESSLIYVLGEDELDSFNAGVRFKKAGKTLTYVGLGVTAAGGLLFAYAIRMARRGELAPKDYSMGYAAGYGIGLGISCLLASIPFKAVGNGKMNAVVDNYNDNHRASINFGVTNNGVGFAFVF